MMEGYLITQRDLELLKDCYAHVQLSFAQIKQRHFPGKSRPTVSNRLAVLRKAKLIASQRVGMVSHLGGYQEIGVVYQVKRRGIKLLQERCPTELFREVLPRINTATLPHDLLLTEVMGALRRRHPEKMIIHGKLFVTPEMNTQRMPDAVLCNRRGQEMVAVELELCAKSETRYRSIVMQYRQNPLFQKVIYVVGNDHIATKIKYQISGQKVIPGLTAETPSKFEFINIGSLMKSHDQEKISIRTGNQFFNQLSREEVENAHA